MDVKAPWVRVIYDMVYRNGERAYVRQGRGSDNIYYEINTRPDVIGASSVYRTFPTHSPLYPVYPGETKVELHLGYEQRTLWSEDTQ